MKEPKFLIHHQINSFNLFLDKGLKNIIEQFNPIFLNYDFVTQQKFYRFKEESKYVDLSNNSWIEYNELPDLFKMFKNTYSIVNNQITTVDLSEHLSAANEKEKLLK